MKNQKRVLRRFKASPVLKISKVIGIIAVVVFFIYLIINLNVFYIQTISVSGISGKELKYINPEIVENVTSEYLGKRIFEIKPDEIKQKVEDSLYFDSEVYVTKKLPDKIEISIQERIPQFNVIINQSFNAEDPISNLDQDSNGSNNGLIIDSDKNILDLCANREALCNSLSRCLLYYPQDVKFEPGYRLYSPEINFVINLKSFLDSKSNEVNEYLIPTTDVVVVQFKDSTCAVFDTEKQSELQFSQYEYTRENAIIQGKSFKEIDLRFEKPVLRVDKCTEWVTE